MMARRPNSVAASSRAWDVVVLLRRLATLAAALSLVLGMILPPPVSAHSDDAPQPGGAAIPAGRQANNVAIITIRGPIDADTYSSIQRRINESVRGGASAIVFDLDTPGGELGATNDICRAIKTCPIANTVAWVHPNALSAGAIISLACREIVISDQALIGDALPITFDPLRGVQSIQDEATRQKFTAPLLANVVNSARRNGYDELLVQGFVSLGVELWLVQNTEDAGRYLFVNRDEYRTVFGEDPPAGRPTIVSASARPDGATVTKPPSDPIPRDLRRLLQPRQPRPSNKPEPASTPIAPGVTPFIPASEELAKQQGDSVIASASSALVEDSTRPVLTEADRGKWRLVEYVADGKTLLTLTDTLALRYGIASPAATPSGRVNTDEDLKAYFGALHLARLDRTAMEATAAFLSSFLVRGLLVAVFLIGLFVEMIHPGLIFPGSAAAIALVLLVAPSILMGLGAWWQIGAILLGIVLLGIELFIIPGFGVFGVLGLLSLFGGLLGTFTAGGPLFPDSPGQGDVLYGVVTLMVAAATAGVAVYAISRQLGRLPVLSKLVLDHRGPDEDGGSGLLAALGPDATLAVGVGDVGVALSPLRPAGRARFGEVVADVTSEAGYIAPGQSIRVIESSPFRIVVEPAAGVAHPPATGASA